MRMGGTMTEVQIAGGRGISMLGVMLVLVGATMPMFARVIVRMAMYGAVGMTVFMVMPMFMLVRRTMAMLARMIVRMRVHGAVRVPVLMRVWVFMGVIVTAAMPVFGGVIVRMAMHGAIGMTMGVRMLVQVLMSGAVPVCCGMVVGVHMHRAVRVPVHMLVVMMVLVTMVMPVTIAVLMGMTVHGAVRVTMFVRMSSQRAPLDSGLAFPTTAYCTHLPSPEALTEQACATSSSRLEGPTLRPSCRAESAVHRTSINGTACLGFVLAHGRETFPLQSAQADHPVDWPVD